MPVSMLIGFLIAALCLGSVMPAFAETGATADAVDLAQAMTTPFPDVPANHWAYDAIAQLAAGGYLKGYPDQTFKGQRPMTRYEVAYLVNQVVQSMADKVSQGRQATQADIDALKKLMTEFGPQVRDLQARVSKLESQTAALATQQAATKTEADATAARVAQGARFGLNLIGRPGTATTNVSVINGGTANVVFGGIPVTPGNALPQISTPAGNAPVTFGAGTPNSIGVGNASHATNLFVIRPFVSGVIDPNWSYGLRLKTTISSELATGASTVSPSLCPNTTSTNCSFTDLSNGQNTLPVTLDYAYMQYTSPGGWSAALGRYTVNGSNYYTANPNVFLLAGQALTGATVAYNDPHHRLFGAFYYGIPSVDSYATAAAIGTPQQVCSTGILGFNSGASQPPLTGVNPNCNATGHQFDLGLTYHVPETGTTVNGGLLTEVQNQFMYWDPAYINSCLVGATNTVAISSAACAANNGVVGPANGAAGNYVTGLGNFALGEVDISQEFGPRALRTWRLDLGGMMRFGVNPFTGSPWTDNRAALAGLTYASKGNIYAGTPAPVTPGAGIKNSNVAQIWFQGLGFNSMPGPSGLSASSQPLPGLGFSNFDGMQVFGATYQHWFSNNVRIGIYGAHINNTPGTSLPVGTNGGANTCRGCFINNLSTNYIYLDSWLYFN